MDSRGKLARAINAGAEAGHSGDPVTSCPFPAGGLHRSEWVCGRDPSTTRAANRNRW
ncbi:Rmf/CrpP fold protein [Streptomyces toxytricini]|uniref:Rmf/CrpP fold protein n=1 Tax=Streptomyces toxytricini TaxID=67369 RepID=A0ABW8ERI6_STRT5